MWNAIADHIRQVTGAPLGSLRQRPVGGGSINQGYALTDERHAYFVKLNQAARVAMFEAEALGLRQMAATQTIRVPQPLCWGTANGSAYLVLEWLDFGYGTHRSWAEMGRNLAAMHRVTSDRGFGWDLDNTIGSTPQPNPWTASWVDFWAEHRIGYQLHLAKKRGGHIPEGDRLLDAIPKLLQGHDPQPSLVHGDLWSGNAAVTQLEEPVIFDPATYFGDREVDLAMTELFGSFPNDFYRAYNEAFPLEPGYAQRKTLYNLYHILNHFNLFGSGYEGQARRMMEGLLKLA
ncbi:fructosamine kinase family protein [Thermoleptolyngbya sp. C42_A2020_037]|uniref:fructosamine kinase family protein n=1 Tax=Thermoleptolyngbya sp. C42_A2020_037 TaxID=2747799 RepID=UPI001A003C62|nr:fructosamine kinase family protein [Thermoleptolyngbya sp. C42_A2020_037]MBF2086603.1 fructosamine kinase family protein [Thermoleptolyngbya sp. C42_A2020_037]